VKFKNFETLFLLHDVKFSGWKDEGVKEEVTPFWKEEDLDRVVDAGVDLHSGNFFIVFRSVEERSSVG
jgi:hypothetical protein